MAGRHDLLLWFFDFHQIGDELPDLAALHLESVAKHRVQDSTIPFLGAHAPLGEDNIGLFRHASYDDGRAAGECLVFNLFVEGLLPANMEHSRNEPFDIVGEAGKNHRMVGTAKSLHIPLNGLLVFGHIALSVGGLVRSAKLEIVASRLRETNRSRLVSIVDAPRLLPLSFVNAQFITIGI
jgi:hypothetical protein